MIVVLRHRSGVLRRALGYFPVLDLMDALAGDTELRRDLSERPFLSAHRANKPALVSTCVPLESAGVRAGLSCSGAG